MKPIKDIKDIDFSLIAENLVRANEAFGKFIEACKVKENRKEILSICPFIVHCKSCKHYIPSNNIGRCHISKGEDWFCGDGVKNET